MLLIKTVYFTLFATSVFSRHVPRLIDLDEEDHQLFRAAYDTPSYNHDEYEEDDDLPLGKLDLLKDGMWAIKAKLKELKAFNKAMAANLLSTKLKVKELVANSLALKKHHHVDIEKKKPGYNYQMPSYPQYAPQHTEPQYAPQHTEPQYAPQHNEPQYAPQYAPPYDPYYGH